MQMRHSDAHIIPSATYALTINFAYAKSMLFLSTNLKCICGIGEREHRGIIYLHMGSNSSFPTPTPTGSRFVHACRWFIPNPNIPPSNTRPLALPPLYDAIPAPWSMVHGIIYTYNTWHEETPTLPSIIQSNPLLLLLINLLLISSTNHLLCQIHFLFYIKN